MQFAFFYSKDIKNIFRKTTDFAENLEMTQATRAGGGGIMFFASLWHNVYENRYAVQPEV